MITAEQLDRAIDSVSDRNFEESAEVRKEIGKVVRQSERLPAMFRAFDASALVAGIVLGVLASKLAHDEAECPFEVVA